MSNRDIIVIGGLAGALVPLRMILQSMPADLPAAVLIVLHIPSHGTGMLTTLATSASALSVRQAADGMTIEPGQIYAAAPDHHLIIHDGRILLGHGPRENLVRPAIDPLFRSAAVH